MTTGQVAKEIIDKNPELASEMLNWIVERAAEFYEECPYDFGLQHYFLPEGIVFGGTNRIVWTVLNGFRCDEKYCSERFILHFRGKMK